MHSKGTSVRVIPYRADCQLVATHGNMSSVRGELPVVEAGDSLKILVAVVARRKW
jgi:hypothetical protein